VAYNGHYYNVGGVASWVCTDPDGDTSGYCSVRVAETNEVIPQEVHAWPTDDGCRFEYTAPSL
jgi:hypothetical protein